VKSRLLKLTAVVGASALILGAFAAGPAEAKKKKKPKKAPVCAPFAPAEAAASAPTTLVTDAATKEAPVTAKVTAEQGLGTGTGTPADEVTLSQVPHVYTNVQVDSAAASTGLYVRVELPANEDYDLYLLTTDGAEVARSAGFNPVPNTLTGVPFFEHTFDGQGYGGHTENGAENIDGIITPDCGGYTLDLSTATGRGGDLTIKYWLGEGTYEPGSGEA
jgi:hypothetical protein